MKWEIIEGYPPPPELEKKWFDFLPGSSYPSHYTSPGFFKEPFWEDQNPFAVLVIDGEKIAGVATGLRNGTRIISGLPVRPQVSVSVTAADREEVVETLLGGFSELAKTDAELLTIFCAERLPGAAAARSGYAEKRSAGSDQVLMLDLTRGAEEIFKGFSQSRRSDLRKAMRENRVRISQLETAEELAELYQIHLDWSRRKQLAPMTFDALRRISAEPDYHRIFIAKHAGKVVAGSYFRFCRGGLFEYSANNSAPEYRHLRPNDLLVWKALEWACGEGFKTCSLGASHLFLRRFGGVLVSSYRYQLDRTFLKRYEKKEAVRDFTLKTYRAIPFGARQTLKRIIGKN